VDDVAAVGCDPVVGRRSRLYRRSIRKICDLYDALGLRAFGNENEHFGFIFSSFLEPSIKKFDPTDPVEINVSVPGSLGKDFLV